MRIRRKKWAEDELAESLIYIHEPKEFKNKWQDKFANNNPIHIELRNRKRWVYCRVSK